LEKDLDMLNTDIEATESISAFNIIAGVLVIVSFQKRLNSRSQWLGLNHAIPGGGLWSLRCEAETSYSDLNRLSYEVGNAAVFMKPPAACRCNGIGWFSATLIRYCDCYSNNSMNALEMDNVLKQLLNAPVFQLRSCEKHDLFDLIKSWKEHEKEYPVLAHIAYNLFAIPCSLAEPERVFSGYYIILKAKINRG
jgi:hypothetical protein